MFVLKNHIDGWPPDTKMPNYLVLLFKQLYLKFMQMLYVQIILRCFCNNFVYCSCQRSIFWRKNAQSLFETVLFNEHYSCRRSISGIPCVPLLLFVRSQELTRLFFRNQIFRNRNPQRFGKSFETEMSISVYMPPGFKDNCNFCCDCISAQLNSMISSSSCSRH